ncbi:N-acetylmuramoyl-L-alanine amidase, partial [Lachnospiraceae bacterium PF1-21]|uniref:GBS Bsp-like repeat-containing protein n=1 Tax=Ohessyouella blattaphilus TaxID=2949333 RepID=UPI003E31B34C
MKLKKIVAMILALTMIISMSGLQTVFAAEENETDTAITESVENEIEGENSEQKEVVQNDTTEEGMVDDVVQETESTESTSEAIDVIKEYGKLNYLYVESPTVESNQEENIIISFGDGTETLENPRLSYTYPNGEEGVFSLSRLEDDNLVFSGVFGDADTGIVTLQDLDIVMNGENVHINLVEIGIEAAFGVNVPYGASDDEAGEDISASVVDISKDEDVETAIETTTSELGSTIAKSRSSLSRATSKDVVVVLDPGHGGSDGGAAANGLVEKVVNLDIALACKAELEEYSGVKVVMTRVNDTYVSLDDRVAIARNAGADLFVSLHNNSGPAGATGAEVYYPNANHNSSVHNAGKDVAQLIQNEIVGLGFPNRGIKTLDYPDGSGADYYHVIRNCKSAGIPAVIVEHGFLTNAADASKLANPTKRQQLGVANAKAIATYFGLSKVPTVQIINGNGYEGTAQIRLTAMGAGARVAVWSEEKQENLVWYPITGSQGTIDFNISNHLNKRGKYIIHVYNNSGGVFYCATTFNVSQAEQPAASNVVFVSEMDKNEQYVTFNAKFSDEPGGIVNVQFPTWVDGKQNATLKWLDAEYKGNGLWSYRLAVSDYGYIGKYITHAYVNMQNGKQYALGGTEYSISPIEAQMAVDNYVKDNGTFDVKVTGIQSVSGIKEVRVAVWSTANQSNLKWYTAQKVSETEYKLSGVSIANHEYAIGNYNVHAYVYAKNGTEKGYGVVQKVEMPDINMSVTDVTSTEKEGTYRMSVSNPGLLGSIKSVQFAVWGEQNGQNDLRWYSATKQNDGTWQSDYNVDAHRESGTYHIHAYATLSNGQDKFIANKTVKVSENLAQVIVNNYVKDKGTFDVKVTGIQSASGVKEVRVAVWSTANQSNLKWYTAQKVSETEYKLSGVS